MLDAPAYQPAAALEGAIALARGALALAGPQAMALSQITLPDLPDPPLSAPVDQGILRAIAPLYLAMEVESTGLTRALSAVAGYYVSGALRLPRGPVAETLLRHHRNYENRLPSDDRYAAYLRLFGQAPAGAVPYATPDAVNSGFEDAMLRLAEAMHRYANLSPLDLAPTAAQRDIRAAARGLAERLINTGGGASQYLADEALQLIATATSVFKDPAMHGALGARDLWGAVDGALSLQSGQPRRAFFGQAAQLARAHLTRGRSGLELLQWVADNAPRLGGVGMLALPRDAPIFAAGSRWLEATLDLLSQAESTLQ